MKELVIPAKLAPECFYRGAGIQKAAQWIPAFAGMTTIALLLAACASDGWVYDAPAGVSAQTLETDRENCALEAGVAMQPEDRGNMERSCMLQRGYGLKREGG